MNLSRLTFRQVLILLHDVVATAAAILLTFFIRFEAHGLEMRTRGLLLFLPLFLLFAALVFLLFGMHRNKWRFTSLPDIFKIVRVSTVLAVVLVALDYILLTPTIYGQFFFGKITILLYWFLQIFFLAGTRVLYRYFRYTRTLQHARVDNSNLSLIVGRSADAEVLLRAIETGAAQRIYPAGVLSPSPADLGQTIRGVPVLGYPDELDTVIADLEKRNHKVLHLILTVSALAPDVKPENLIMRARRLGLSVSRLPSLEARDETARLTPVAVEDLLLRPSVQIDYRRLENFVRGKAVVVTGGGGSIGAEICDRVVAFGAGRLLVIENSEPGLHTVLETLKTKQAQTEIVGRIGDVRDRVRITRLMENFKPDIVFHAAALKQVPFLEDDWDEGIKTNVFGSINVADAAVATGAQAMVMISTDKAIEPVSVLGATKRLAEMYCQALDRDFAKAGNGGRHAMRFIAVRFGNVLASNGSVVPKFKAQIEAGGPVTVTHPDMVRYFMTIREACDLVVTAASHALAPEQSDLSVYVLNMGQPVKIVDLAENMIRLSGLEPGRDIEIVFTGIRPGERLNEILFASEEPVTEIGIPGIVGATTAPPSLDEIRQWIKRLEGALSEGSQAGSYNVLSEAVPDFRNVAHEIY